MRPFDRPLARSFLENMQASPEMRLFLFPRVSGILGAEAGGGGTLGVGR